MIKVIFFDFDGVIVESTDIKTNAFAKLFEEEGRSAAGKIVDYHLRNMGVSRYEKFKHIYKDILKRPLSDKIFKELCDRFSKLVVDEVVGAPYVKGVIEFMERNRNAYSYFVTSATPQPEIEDIIERRCIAHYFRAVYGAPKTKPEMVREVLDSCAIEGRESAYIGDALSDYEAASANKVNFIARIKDNEELFRGIDCIRIKDLSGLDEALKTVKTI